MTTSLVLELSISNGDTKCYKKNSSIFLYSTFENWVSLAPLGGGGGGDEVPVKNISI
jgi:hypothetical protein